MTLTVCVECGEVCNGPRCPDHARRISVRVKASASARGYDAAWQRLSTRARKLQPWCTDCGATDDLQADHSPEAWERKAAGLPITLDLIAVVCGQCNRARGAARGDLRARGVSPLPNLPDPPSGRKVSERDRN